MSAHDRVVPLSSRSAPAVAWVSHAQLEAQLQRVRAKVVDPNVGLFGPDSLMWRIGRCHLATGLGSGRALLLQVAHPWVTQAVDQHSRTRTDPIGRARRTFTNVLSMTLGSLDQALAAAARVHGVHSHIQGQLGGTAGAFAAGTEYRANEAHALLWVHATLWDSAVRMYELIVEPLSCTDKERFYAETKLFAYLFGIPDEILPRDWAAFAAYNEAMWNSDELAVTDSARELTRFLFKPLAPGLGPLMRAMQLVTAASLPPRLREEFRLPYDAQSDERFGRIVQRVRRLHRTLPDRLRYSPSYFEAMARIQGRKSDVFTRLATRITLGRWRLVS